MRKADIRNPLRCLLMNAVNSSSLLMLLQIAQPAICCRKKQKTQLPTVLRSTVRKLCHNRTDQPAECRSVRGPESSDAATSSELNSSRRYKTCILIACRDNIPQITSISSTHNQDASAVNRRFGVFRFTGSASHIPSRFPDLQIIA